MLDDELKDEIREDIPEVSWQFISSVSGEGISSLKDRIWQELND
jgi:GTP-binding protein